MTRIGSAFLALIGAAAVSLAACGGDSGSSNSPGSPTPAAQFGGSVHGGQSPVSGSVVTLYVAGIGASGATALATGVTDASGNFQIGSYTCPASNRQTYYVAKGGNPGLGTGTNNSAMLMMAALGPCSGIPPSVKIDEVTTVAAAYALNGFIGSSGCVDCGSGLPTAVTNVHGNSPGLPNAMATAALLASVGKGLASPPLPTASVCGASSPPANCSAEQRLDSLANSLAACVNTSGPGSAQCVELFQCATPGATFAGSSCSVPAGSQQASDTLTAILEVARNAGLVPAAGVYDVSTRNVVFSPALTAAPTDWTLSLNHTGCGLSNPYGVAVDAGGNVWVANYNASTLCEFSPTGKSPASGYSGGGLHSPQALAIDFAGNVWASNQAANLLSGFSASGVPLGASGFSGGGLNNPFGPAIDPSGNVWIADINSNAISEFNGSGAALSGSGGYTGGGLNTPQSLAIDANGTVWVANFAGNSLSEFSSSGTAVSSTAFTGGGLSGAAGTAIDPSGNIWISDYNGSALSEFNALGSALSGAGGYTGGGLASPFLIAIDAGGNVWAANAGAGHISEFDNTGAALSPSGFSGSGLSNSSGIAVDASGNVWVATGPTNSLVEFIGAAAPTRTPVAAAITQGFVP